MVEDEKLGWIELVACGAAIGKDGEKKYQRRKKDDKRGGETLVVTDPEEKAIEVHFKSTPFAKLIVQRHCSWLKRNIAKGAL